MYSKMVDFKRKHSSLGIIKRKLTCIMHLLCAHPYYKGFILIYLIFENSITENTITSSLLFKETIAQRIQVSVQGYTANRQSWSLYASRLDPEPAFNGFITQLLRRRCCIGSGQRFIQEKKKANI